MAGDGSEQLIIDGKRLDGRGLDELRPISIRVGILANADGSAEIRMGRNIIIAAVYGPRELHPKHRALPDKALIQCFYRMCTFSVKERKSPAPSRREREISKIISEALESVVLTEKFPRTTIDVYIQVLQADGGTRCASLTAAAVALADAGIPMRGLISAVAAGLANDQVILDLCDIEDQKGSGDVPLGYSPALNEISLLQLDGVFTIEQFKEAVSKAIEGSKTIYELQKAALKEKYASIREEVAAQEEELSEVEKESEEIIKQSVEEKALEQEGAEEVVEELKEEVEEVQEVVESTTEIAVEGAEETVSSTEVTSDTVEPSKVSEASTSTVEVGVASPEQSDVSEKSEEALEVSTESSTAEQLSVEGSVPEVAVSEEIEKKVEEDVEETLSAGEQKETASEQSEEPELSETTGDETTSEENQASESSSSDNN